MYDECNNNLRDGCSPVNLLHIFRTSLYKKSYGGMLLNLHFEGILDIFGHKISLQPVSIIIGT